MRNGLLQKSVAFKSSSLPSLYSAALKSGVCWYSVRVHHTYWYNCILKTLLTFFLTCFQAATDLFSGEQHSGMCAGFPAYGWIVRQKKRGRGGVLHASQRELVTAFPLSRRWLLHDGAELACGWETWFRVNWEANYGRNGFIFILIWPQNSAEKNHGCKKSVYVKTCKSLQAKCYFKL